MEPCNDAEASSRGRDDGGKMSEYIAKEARRAKLLKKYRTPTRVLDHGMVRLVDVMGDDTAIVQAARVSYGAGESSHVWAPNGVDASDAECSMCNGVRSAVGDTSRCVAGDRRLIRYLVRNRHTSPLEMCEIKFHMKMPIFVARQFIRHRTASVNEYSMRYSAALDEFHLIGVDEWRGQSSDNKQCSEGSIGAAIGRDFTAVSESAHSAAMAEYERKIKYGVSRELARCDLPLSMYTEWYWKIDLHNLLHFISLRLHPHAQKEAQVFADAIASIVKRWTPLAWEAFTDYRSGSQTFSRMEMDILRCIADGSIVPGWHKSPATRIPVFERFNVETVRERKAFLAALSLK